MHARKMAARVQALAANDFDADPILLWVERSAGHGAGKPLRLRIRNAADQWSFIMWRTGIVEGSRWPGPQHGSIPASRATPRRR